MSRKMCKRKHYEKINTIDFAIAGVRPTPQAELNQLHTRELSALEALAHGHGTLQEWHDMHAVVNLCEVAAKMHIGREALASCKDAQDALIDAAQRFESTGRMGLSGPGLVALRDVVAYHHLQRTSIDRATYEAVIRNSINKVRTGADRVLA